MRTSTLHYKSDVSRWGTPCILCGNIRKYMFSAPGYLSLFLHEKNAIFFLHRLHATLLTPELRFSLDFLSFYPIHAPSVHSRVKRRVLPSGLTTDFQCHYSICLHRHDAHDNRLVCLRCKTARYIYAVAPLSLCRFFVLINNNPFLNPCGTCTH